jgi:hypothetical protein
MIVTDSMGLEQALTQASLTTEFEPERLVENESSRFTATVTYGRSLGREQKLEVAYANDAILRPLDHSTKRSSNSCHKPICGKTWMRDGQMGRGAWS